MTKNNFVAEVNSKYYLLRYSKKQKQLVGLFFNKGVLEFMVKILDKYTYKEFLKITFLN